MEPKEFKIKFDIPARIREVDIIKTDLLLRFNTSEDSDRDSGFLGLFVIEYRHRRAWSVREVVETRFSYQALVLDVSKEDNERDETPSFLVKKDFSEFFETQFFDQRILSFGYLSESRAILLTSDQALVIDLGSSTATLLKSIKLCGCGSPNYAQLLSDKYFFFEYKDRSHRDEGKEGGVSQFSVLLFLGAKS